MISSSSHKPRKGAESHEEGPCGTVTPPRGIREGLEGDSEGLEQMHYLDFWLYASIVSSALFWISFIFFGIGYFNG